jgi:hypothetical protein
MSLDDLPTELQDSIRSVEQCTGFKVNVEPVFERSKVAYYDPSLKKIGLREVAEAYGVAPWWIDARYDTPKERLRWRLRPLRVAWRWLKRRLRGRSRRRADRG